MVLIMSDEEVRRLRAGERVTILYALGPKYNPEKISVRSETSFYGEGKRRGADVLVRIVSREGFAENGSTVLEKVQ